MGSRKKRTNERKVSASSTQPRAAAVSWLKLGLGAVFIGLAALMTLLLVFQHFGGLTLPGCGEGGGCEEAINSVWGKVSLNGFEWPVSFLGLAYFLGLLVAWTAARGCFPRLLSYLIRLGALASLGFGAILILDGMFCPYCVVIHIANLAFWLTMELAKAPAIRPRFVVAGAGVVFVLVTSILGILDAQYRATTREKAEQERSAATQAIIEKAVASTKVKTILEPSTPGASEEPAREAPIFTGRFRIGPAEAPIRIVIFTGYQCRDCYEIEQQLKQLHETRNDISISIRHFPFNSDCNPFVSKRIHRNDCWAARAAEAAGILWGSEGFWKMHTWLFDRRGVFKTTRELEDGIRAMGYDPAGFTKIMNSERTLEAIRDDAKEAKRLGLYFTPMIFINGIELKGWSAPNALIRTVEEVAATNPPARSAAYDQPSPALEKCIADWREQPLLALLADAEAWVLGPQEALVRIVMWGDYQESGTAEADSIIRAFATGRSDVQYVYRHFPFNSDCNPNLSERRHPNACRAARAAEAAGRLAGNERVFWRMHLWLMETRGQFNDETLRQAATEMGFDGGAFLTAAQEAELQTNILYDIQAGGRLPKLRHGVSPGIFAVPSIFLNGRYVPRWQLDDQQVLSVILAEAAK